MKSLARRTSCSLNQEATGANRTILYVSPLGVIDVVPLDLRRQNAVVLRAYSAETSH